MDDDTQMQAEHERDMQQFQQYATEALKASQQRPLTPDEAAALAWMAGIPQQEIRA